MINSLLPFRIKCPLKITHNGHVGKKKPMKGGRFQIEILLHRWRSIIDVFLADRIIYPKENKL
jgi:hypothetical protein